MSHLSRNMHHPPAGRDESAHTVDRILSPNMTDSAIQPTFSHRPEALLLSVVLITAHRSPSPPPLLVSRPSQVKGSKRSIQSPITHSSSFRCNRSGLPISHPESREIELSPRMLTALHISFQASRLACSHQVRTLSLTLTRETEQFEL